MIGFYINKFLETFEAYISLTGEELGMRSITYNGMDLPTVNFELRERQTAISLEGSL